MAARWIRHPATWIFAPTVIALLYAAGHRWLAPEPTLRDLPPKEAVLVQRFRSMKTFDQMQPPAEMSPSAIMGANLNIPGLPGVDRAGPVHLIQMPRTSATPRSLVVLSVEDADAIERRFNDIELIEKGFIRHAQHLHLRGGWAAFSPDRDVARRIGEGGITAEDREEDFSLAADVPRLVKHALTMPRTEPWKGLLDSFGVRIEAAVIDLTQGAVPQTKFQDTGHLRRLQTSWSSARMWAWFAKEGRPYLEVSVQPRRGPIYDLLAALPKTSSDTTSKIAIPREADAWLRIPDGDARAALAIAAFSMGFAFGHAADAPPETLPPAISTLSQRTGGLVLWTEPSLQKADAFELVAAAPTGQLLDPASWLPVVDLQVRTIEGVDVAAGGPQAKRTLDRYRASALADRARAPRWEPVTGERTLATFRISAKRVREWLGGLIGPGGLWGLLRDHAVEGRVTTDGAGLRLSIRGVGPGT